VSLTVTVNEKAEPGMSLHNMAELWADPNMLVAIAVEDTPICCWAPEPNIIYVDMTATGSDNGINWANAYSGLDGLQRALTRASESTCDAWPYTFCVAQGLYSPGDYTSDSFTIPEGSSVYGGFMAGGSEFSERNPDAYETVLAGHIFVDDDPNENYHYHIYNDTVVTMEDMYVSDANFPVDECSLLNGFTIADTVEYGVYGTDVDFTIANCTVADSGKQGIYAANGDAAIKWSNIKNSGEDGIYHTGEGNTIAVENCRIIDNKKHGVFSSYSIPTVKNCVIFGNGYFDEGFEGVKITLPTGEPVLYNNTIVYNSKEGISWFDDRTIEDPNDKDYPDIQNSILWNNNDGGGGAQVAGFDEDVYAAYCCIEGCDDTQNNNIDETPGFVMGIDESSAVNPYMYHLAYDSICKDIGNPVCDGNDFGLYDIDGEERIIDPNVDIGADELYSCDDDLSEDDIFNSLDWNFDGLVNNREFGEFADVWLVRDPNDPGIITDPNYSSDPDYASPETLAMWFEKWDSFYNLDPNYPSEYMIDIYDFIVIANDWVWAACWKQSQLELFEEMAMSMMMGGGEYMMMMPMEIGFASSSEPEPKAVEMSTAEIVSFVEGIYGIIEELEKSIEAKHEDSESLYDMKEFLEEVLKDLDAEY